MKYAWIFLDDQVAEAVEGADLDFVGFGADIFDEAMAHFGSGGIGVGEAQDAGWGSVGFAYDITDAEGEDFCFSGTGACDDHDGAFDGVNGEALVGVEGV